MKIFEVTQSKKGKRTINVLKANNSAQAREIAAKRIPGAPIIKVKELRSMPLSAQLGELKMKLNNSLFRPNIKMPNLVATVRQLAVMTGAGISIHDAIKEVVKSTEDKRLSEIFLRADEDLNAGMSLTESLSAFRDELGNITVSMVQLGEHTGNMAESLTKLAEILQDVWDNKIKFKKAIRYPITVLVAIAVAFTILMVVVVHKFREIFEQLNTELPLPTQILLGMESAITNYGLYILGGLIIISYIILRIYKTNPDAKMWIDTKLLKVYLIGNIIFFSSMNRFNLIFSELMRAGIPVIDALDTALSTIDNSFLRARFTSVKLSVQRGSQFAEAIRQTGIYEGMLIQMIDAGEKTGSLDEMLGRVSDYYKSRFNNIVDNIAAYVEPILLVFIAGAVLLLALGIFMPMWDMAKAAKN